MVYIIAFCADILDMKRFFAALVLVAAFAQNLSAQGGTLLVVIRGQPSRDTAPFPSARLRPLADQIESALLDECFEEGFVVSSFPPLLADTWTDAVDRPAQVRRWLMEAGSLKAGYLVVVDLEAGDLPPGGHPPIRSVGLEVHRLSDGTVSRKMLDPSPVQASEAGFSLAKALGECL